MSKFKQGQKVYVKELGAFGTIDSTTGYVRGERVEIQTVRVKTPSIVYGGVPYEKVIDITDKSYTIISGIAKILYFILQFLRSR